MKNKILRFLKLILEEDIIELFSIITLSISALLVVVVLFLYYI